MRTSPLARDLRLALRTLIRTPGFTLVAVLTFAIGIGVNTAVFSVFNGVLLQPLPYPEPDRITMVWMDNRLQGIKEDITSYPTFRDWMDQSTSFAHMAAYTPTAFNLTGVDEPERLQGAMTTARFFDVMGVRPALGRLYTESQEKPGSDDVVLISHGLWQRQFGGSLDVLGRTITLSGRAHEVIGVMPATLQVPADAEVWKPLAPSDNARTARGAFWLPVIGRLKTGVTVEQAQSEMSGIAARLEHTYPANRGFGVYLVPLHRQLVGDIERSMVILLAAVAFVLLIACANLGNLMLGRTAARRKELAIRMALGANRWRLVRQIVVEALVLATAGTAIGLFLAFWATRFFIALGGDTIPRPDAIGIDTRVLLFTIAIGVLSSMLAGIVPAFFGSRTNVGPSLREGGREEGAVGTTKTRAALVTAEVALAFVLLAGAGLLMRTLWTMEHFERGFGTERIATVRLSLPSNLYAGQSEVRAFFARVLDRVRTVPGVESAASGTGVLMPLLANSGNFSFEGRPQPPPEQRIEYPVESVSPGYFETLGATLAAGRTFAAGDHADAPLVAIVNETLAKREWPGQDPIGRRLRPGDDTSTAPWMTVVGVVRDLRRADLRRPVRPEIYYSALQRTPRTQMLLVRTSGDPNAIVSTIRREVHAIDPQLPLYSVSTLDDQVGETLTSPRFRAVLLAGFAAIALALAAIGIYGVTSHAVAERTHEVGIRMALGANRGDVLSLVLGQHLRPVLMGVGLGLTGALVLSQSMRTFVYGVGVIDPLSLVSMAASLLAVAALACTVPAHRAARVDPLIALRGR